MKRWLLASVVASVALVSAGIGAAITYEVMDGEPGGLDRVESFDAKGTTLMITYGDNACSVAERRIAVEETDTEVVVTLRTVGTGDVCLAYALQTTSEVPLSSPIGGRRVIDASTGKEIARCAPDQFPCPPPQFDE